MEAVLRAIRDGATSVNLESARAWLGGPGS